MKRVVFIIPKASDQACTPSTPHVGVSCLAAFIRENGHTPFIIDLRVEDICFSSLIVLLEEVKPHFVAVTSTSAKYKETYALINEISLRGWLIIYGGPHVSTFREEIFSECAPFAAIYGEGEKALEAILDDVELHEIPGVIYRNCDNEVIVNPPCSVIENLDSLPFPAYELSKLDLYAEKKIPLTTSRGCPSLCTFCNVPCIMERGFRARSPENVVDEIEEWYNNGYQLFGINDDNFTADIRRVDIFCDILLEKNLNISWELRTGVRIDKVNESLLYKMKSAGCAFLAFGIESIDDSVLCLAKKGVNFSQIERTVTAAEKVGIPFSGFFIIGLPGDTLGKFSKLYQFVEDHDFDEVRFYNLEPYPKTEVYDWVKTHGNLLTEPQEYLQYSGHLHNRPLFETEEYTLRERKHATRLGEFLMVKKLLVKTLGHTLGNVVSVFARQRHVRAFILKVGFRLAPIVRKIHFKKSQRLPY